MTLEASVVLPTRNPDPVRLKRTFEGLESQSLERSTWELLVVDNGSESGWPHPSIPALDCSVLSEPRAGLTLARIRGIRAARGKVVVFVDDDNVLSPGYLEAAVGRFSGSPRLGAAGGPVLPEWQTSPPLWITEFRGLLALRDLGASVLVCNGGPGVRWPDFAPVGAGLCIRRDLALAYADVIAGDPMRRALDRTGKSLGSGGDNDLVFSVLHGGDDVAYFPELSLIHLIPGSRLDPAYLGRLNEGVMRTWVLVLHLHGQCPWPAIQPWTVPIRSARAWLRTRAWASPANYVRWKGRCGQFRGQALLTALSNPGHD